MIGCVSDPTPAAAVLPAAAPVLAALDAPVLAALDGPVLGVVVDAPVLEAVDVPDPGIPVFGATELLPVPSPDDPVYPAALTSPLPVHVGPVDAGDVVLLPVCVAVGSTTGDHEFGLSLAVDEPVVTKPVAPGVSVVDNGVSIRV